MLTPTASTTVSEAGQRYAWRHWRLLLSIAGVAVLVGLFLLRLVHFLADFPPGVNFSGDLYADEGYWATNAVSSVVTGYWYRLGDYNPGITAPVLPLLERVTFALAGMSLTAARLLNVLLFGLSLLLVYRLLARYVSVRAGWIAVLLLTTNFVVFLYSRLALLEVPFTLLIMASFYTALRGTEAQASHRWRWITLSALAAAGAVLTKMGAVHALPMLVLALFLGQSGRPWRERVSWVACWFVLVILVLGGYALVAWLGYADDIRYFLAINVTPKYAVTPTPLLVRVQQTLTQAHLLDPRLLFPAIILSTVGILSGRFQRHRIFVPCWLWAGAYLAMIAAQALAYFPPRYLIPLAFPLAILVGILLDALGTRLGKWWGLLAVAAILGWAVLPQLVAINQHLTHPRYTLTRMLVAVQWDVRRDTDRPVVAGTCSGLLALASGMPFMNDNLGTWPMPRRLARYQPTHWYNLGPLTAGQRAQISPYARPVLARTYDAMGNYYNGPVHLYRLERR